MKTIILFDHQDHWADLLPLTFTRPIAALRIGIVTIADKWQWYTGQQVASRTLPYLEELFPRADADEAATGNFLYINAGLLPTAELWHAIDNLPLHNQLWSGSQLLAWHRNKPLQTGQCATSMANWAEDDALCMRYEGEVQLVLNPTDIFTLNAAQIRHDYEHLTRGRTSAPLNDPFTRVYGPENVFLEEGASVKAAIINAEDGPVYIGKHAQVQEGVMIKGPLALCEGAVLNMGAKLRGDTTLGPFCKVGGEVSNVVFQAFSNKGHDGFLGNSAIGAWCNLGADTNSSNLKNNYKPVDIHNYRLGKSVPTDKLFCGLIMGDHSKAGINTMFNTGTVVGVGCNIYGGGFPAKHIPPFTWGGPQDGYGHYKIAKLLETERVVMARRKLELSPAYERMLHHLHQYLQDQDQRVPAMI